MKRINYIGTKKLMNKLGVQERTIAMILLNSDKPLSHNDLILMLVETKPNIKRWTSAIIKKSKGLIEQTANKRFFVPNKIKKLFFGKKRR